MRLTLKKVLSVGSALLIVGIIIFYAIFQSRALIAGPIITLSEPQNNITLSEPLLLIRGVATNAKSITLQGREIFIDLEGRFTEQLLLSPGYNIIVLTATDTRGQRVIKKLELVYHAPEENITPK